MKHTKWFRRGATVVALGVGIAFAGAACDAVDNLLQVLEDEVDSPELVDVLKNSVVGEFQDLYDDPFIWRASMLTDEQVTGVNWEATARINRRVISYTEGPAERMFEDLSSARMMADTVAGRYRNGLLDDPGSDERMATVLAYAGYSYILMADVMCRATLNVGATFYEPTELYGMAVDRLEEALQVAGNAGADDVANLARVGLARAHLNLGNDQEVQNYAADVPESFVWWVEYADQNPSLYNTMWNRISGGNHMLGVHPRFLNGTFGDQGIEAEQTDPRIQHTTDWSHGHNGSTPLYKPYQSLPYSGYNGEAIADGGEPILYEQGTDIKLASGLEALHHYYEAAGAGGTGPAGSTQDFVNDRRAFGNQGATNATGADLMSELREQRARDLYLGGFRLGDLRRWARQGIDDPDHVFPTGEHVNPAFDPYGDATCFPIPNAEYEGNDSIANPHG